MDKSVVDLDPKGPGKGTLYVVTMPIPDETGV